MDTGAPTIEEALAPLVERLVAKFLRALAPEPGWIPHTASPLGRVKTASLCRTGQLPAKRVKGTKLWLIQARDLDAYIEANSLGAEEAPASGTRAPTLEADLDRVLAAKGKRRRA